MEKSKNDKYIEIERDGVFKPKLVEKGCWNCALGEEAFGKTCFLCMTTGKSRWRKKPKYRRRKGK